MAVAVAIACIAVTVAGLGIVGGIEPHALVEPSTLGAAFIGVVGAMLATFTGCASIPSRQELAVDKGNVQALRAQYLEEDASVTNKGDKLERRLEAIQKEGTKSFYQSSDEAKMAELAVAGLRTLEQMSVERATQRRIATGLADKSDEIIDKADDVLKTVEDRLRQTSLAEPSSPGEARSQYMLGWDEYRRTLRSLIEAGRRQVAAKRADLGTFLQHDDEAEAALARLEILLERVSMRSSLEDVRQMLVLGDVLTSGRRELLHLSYGSGWEDVVAVAEFFERSTGPTVVLTRPEQGERTARIAARIVLDELMVGEVSTGSVLVLDLPAGVRLTEPMEVVTPEGMQVRVCGNEAGSQSVAVHVVRSPEQGPREIVLGLDQELVIEREGPSLGELRMWNLGLDVGTTLTVARLPTCDVGLELEPIRERLEGAVVDVGDLEVVDSNRADSPES